MGFGERLRQSIQVIDETDFTILLKNYFTFQLCSVRHKTNAFASPSQGLFLMCNFLETFK